MKMTTLSFVPVLAMLVACSTTIEEEESARSESGLSCMPVVGSPGWMDKLRECAASVPSSGGSSCSSAVSCTNGACKCESGPNAGAVCDGTTISGAQSCSVLCKVCSGGGSSSGGSPGGGSAPGAGGGAGAAPPPPAAPPPGTQECNAVTCTNGGCRCIGGPNDGKECEAGAPDAPNACNTVCKYTAEKCEGAPPFIFPF